MKIAIVLFNLGGPDSPEAVQPFLRNLFSDPAIISLPSFFRLPLARFIASRRARRRRRRIYAQDRRQLADPRPDRSPGAGAGGGAGAGARMARLCLHALLASDDRSGRAFGQALRARSYRAAAALSAILHDDDGLVGESVEGSGGCTAKLNVPTQTVCCYPDEEGFIAASVELVKQGLAEAGESSRRACCSPRTDCRRRVIKAGDPYQAQVERSSQSHCRSHRRSRLGSLLPEPCRAVEMDRSLRPTTRSERAGKDGKADSALSAGLRIGAFRDAGRTRHGLPGPQRDESGVPAYVSCTDGRHSSRPSSRVSPTACAPCWQSRRSRSAMARRQCPAAAITVAAR